MSFTDPWEDDDNLTPWEITENDAESLVTDKFAEASGLVTTYSANVDRLMQDLVNAISTFNPSIDEAEYADVSPPTIDFSSFLAPDKPVTGSIDTSNTPVLRGDIIPIPAIIAPEKPVNGTITDPPPTLVFEELPYASELLTNLVDAVNSIVINGGQGLRDEVFASILDLALSADELEYEKAYRDAENYYVSKGHEAPPGALIARINMLLRERYRNQQRTTSELNNKQADLAYQQEQAMMTLGSQLEELTIGQKNDVENRAYQLAKDHVTFFHSAVENSIKLYAAELDAYKTEWSAEEVKVKAVSASNKSVTDTYIAEMDGYKVGITTELGIIEQITKVYVAEMSGYDTAVKAEATKADSLIAKYKAQIEEAGYRSKISISNADLVLQAAIAKWDASKDVTKALADLSGQITASALSAVNASASLSSGLSKNIGYSRTSSASYSYTDSNSVSENNNYNYSV